MTTAEELAWIDEQLEKIGDTGQEHQLNGRRLRRPEFRDLMARKAVLEGRLYREQNGMVSVAQVDRISKA